jgi:hypothetical protein
MHIKLVYTQQHCYDSLETLYPWRDLNPGLLVSEADAMSTHAARATTDNFASKHPLHARDELIKVRFITYDKNATPR